MEKILILGAGRTGRGFIGRLAAEADLPVIFADKDEKLIESLSRAKSEGGYTVRFYGDRNAPVTVSDYETAGPKERVDFSDINTVMVSVGGSNLSDAAVWLKENLPRDRQMYVITCENAASPAERLQQAIGLQNVLVSEAAIFCTTNAAGTDILSEDYPVLPFDASRLPGFTPPAMSFRGETNFGNLLKRKILTYNAASGIIAYMGNLYGYTDYAEAANDPSILKLLDKNYEATNRAICKEFDYDIADQEEFAALSKKKFTNPAIVDTIARNAREPQRKLGPDERILGPIKLLIKNGEDADVLYRTAAAALLYEDDTDPIWTEIKETCSPDEILRKYGKLQNEEVMEHILGYYEAFINETEQ